jgi:hypothetical protein
MYSEKISIYIFIFICNCTGQGVENGLGQGELEEGSKTIGPGRQTGPWGAEGSGRGSKRIGPGGEGILGQVLQVDWAKKQVGLGQGEQADWTEGAGT